MSGDHRPGAQHLVKNLIKQMEKDGNRFEDIGLIIATHGHRTFEGTQTFAGGGSRLPSIGQRNSDGNRWPVLPRHGQEMPELKVSFISRRELKVAQTFQIIHTRAFPGPSASMAGEKASSPRCGLPHGRRADGFPGGRHALRESIERLAQLDAEWLLSGLGRSSRAAEHFAQLCYIRTNYYDYLRGLCFSPREKA
jgi:hypothetical protein